MLDEQGNENLEDSNAKEDVYIGPKSRPKIVRILTVLAYVLSVSMAAILLSVYYIFMWDGQPTLASRKASPRNLEPDVHKPIEIYNNTFEDNGRINITDDVEFDRLLKRLILSGNATSSGLFAHNQSFPRQIIDGKKENLNGITTSNQTAEERKQLNPPISTSTYEENLFITTTTTEDVVDVNTETELSTLDFNDLGRKSLLYKKLFRRKLL